MAQNVTDSTFEQEVLGSDLPVIVDFWAEWCGPCRMLAPLLDEASKEMAGRVKIVKINVDECPHISAQYNVRTIPTLILFKNGKATSTKVGLLTKQKLIEWIQTDA